MSRAVRRDRTSTVVAVVGNDRDFADWLDDHASPAVRVWWCPRPADLAQLAVRPAAVLVGRSARFAEAVSTCRQLRDDPAHAGVPILLFGSRDRPEEEAAALAAGADDFVDRSAPTAVVAARVEALVRRSAGGSAGAPTRGGPPHAGTAADRRAAVADLAAARAERHVLVGAIAVDPDGYAARVHGLPVPLTVGEFRLLWKLVRNVGRVLSPSQLAETEAGVGRDGMPSEHAVRSRVFCLRQKLGPAARQIETVRGAGYRLVE